MMKMNLCLFVAMLICNISFGQTTKTNIEIGQETSKLTLWYPKAKAEKNELNRLTILIKSINEPKLSKLVGIETNGKFACIRLNASLKSTGDTILIDSLEIEDWIYFENRVVFAGFVMREVNWKQYQKVARMMGCKANIFRIVSSDFITESKKPVSYGPIDTMALHILRTRYKGGIDAFYKFLSSTIVYPEYARYRGLEGYTYLSFTLLPSGELNDMEIIKSIGGNTQESVIATYQKMPIWNKSSSNESIRLTLPVAFKLQ